MKLGRADCVPRYILDYSQLFWSSCQHIFRFTICLLAKYGTFKWQLWRKVKNNQLQAVWRAIRQNERPDKMHLFPDLAAVAVCCHELIEDLGCVRHSLRYIIWKPSIVYLFIFQLGFKPCHHFSFYFFFFFFFLQSRECCLPACCTASLKYCFVCVRENSIRALTTAVATTKSTLVPSILCKQHLWMDRRL